MVEGSIRTGMKILMMASGSQAEVNGVGVFAPEMSSTEVLEAGQVGFFHAAIKEIGLCKVGDTVTSSVKPGNGASAWLR